MDEQRNFIGKIAFYRDIDNLASRGFLRRNLRHALDSHERDLLREKSDAPDIEKDPATEYTRLPEWEPPGDHTMAYLMQLCQDSKPVLRISSLHLSNPAHGPRQPRGKTKDSWLPEPDEFIRSCQINIIVWDKRLGGGRIIHNDMRQGRIVGHDNSNGLTFDIELQNTFDIDIKKLSSNAPSYTGKGPWERHLVENCVLEFAIQFQDSDSTAEFISQIEGHSVNDYLTTPGSEGIIRAVWSNLPKLPQDGELLTLRRTKGHKSVDLKYKAEIVMGWNERQTPLVRHTRALRRKREELRQLPTPASDDFEAPRTKCTIKYLFRQGAFEVRSIVTEHLKCILCRHEHEQSSFERLHLHYTMHHDHFRFEVDERSKDLKIIRIHHAQDEHSAHDTEYDWEAPTGAFDIRAHLRGDKGRAWAPQDPRRIAVKSETAKAKTTKAAAQGLGQPLILARPKRTFTVPEEIEDLVTHKRKKHVVPNVPGVVFYRTTSKQILLPGLYRHTLFICQPHCTIDPPHSNLTRIGGVLGP